MVNRQPSLLPSPWLMSGTDYGPLAPGSCQSLTVLQQTLDSHHPDPGLASLSAPRQNPLPFLLKPLCYSLKKIADRTPLIVEISITPRGLFVDSLFTRLLLIPYHLQDVCEARGAGAAPCAGCWICGSKPRAQPAAHAHRLSAPRIWE